MMKRVFFLPALTILTYSLGFSPTEGAILRVPQDHATIQSAIDAAVSGDTVLVSRGTYSGGLRISGKTIRLASNYINTADPGDIAQTIISGGSPVISIESTAVDTTVQGLTFQSGSYGLVNYAARMSILNNRFINISSDAVSFESAGGVCRDNYFESSSDDAIDSDHSSADTTIENNTILSSGDDGIEIRLQSYTGPMISIVIRNNYIAGSDEDGIQLIDSAGLSSRTFRIERNVIVGNGMVGLGCMPDGRTAEDFGGAPLQEEVQVVNNTFSGNPYGVTGGDTMLLMNNIFTGSTETAVKRVSASSLVSHNDFWSNGLDYSDANVDLATTLYEDPLLDASYNLEAGSPGIDAGAASLVWNWKTVDAPPYSVPAPDLGARETSGGPTLPTVTVTATDPIASELGLDPGAFTVSRAGATDETLMVSYSLAGTASNGGDYEGLTGSATIDAGASSAVVTVAPVDDPLEEGSETVILDLRGDPAYTLSSPNSASVTIVDDEIVVPMVTITATDAFAAEAGQDAGTFTVTRTGDTALPLAVDFTIGGDATNGVDYQTIGTSVVIPGGSASATITVTPVDDLVVDDEEVVVTIAASPFYVVGTPGGASVTITDDDQVTVLEVRVSSSSDDAEQRTTSTDLTSSDLELTVDGTVKQTVGMRFNEVAIPRGATIVAAHVQFKVDETSSTVTTLTIFGEAADNPPTFTSAAGNISSRTRASATVAWTPQAWTTVGQAGAAQRTPDLRAVIQEIVDRPGWASGNSQVVIITGDGLGKRVTEAYDGDAAGAALLHVEFQTGPPVNQPPTVSAGTDQTVNLPNGASLSGDASDDGLPNPPGAVTVTWTGPAGVSFGDPSALSTTATFPAEGIYGLTLAASDGALSASDDVVVTVKPEPVNQPPTVSAGADQTITLPNGASLSGSASDDGLPNPPGAVTFTWTGSAGVSFGDPSAPSTAATFPAEGTYSLTLAANDGALSASDDIVVTVNPAPPNQRPTVNAGEDQTITSSSPASLNGTASDDGLPTGELVTTWTKLSGPGTVDFGNASALNTTAIFSTPGIYELQLMADDGVLSATDRVIITVDPAPLTVEVRVASSSDDAEQRTDTGKMSLTSSDLQLTTDGTASQVVGIRFNRIALVRGATIVNAYVQFKADETGSTATSLIIQGQAADNGPTFARAAGDVSSRPKTAAHVMWTPPAWPTVGASGPDQRTPNIASVIEEIVDRPGWVSGNSLVILISGTGRRVAESYNGDKAGAPLLHVEYR